MSEPKRKKGASRPFSVFSPFAFLRGFMPLFLAFQHSFFALFALFALFCTPLGSLLRMRGGPPGPLRATNGSVNAGRKLVERARHGPDYFLKYSLKTPLFSATRPIYT